MNTNRFSLEGKRAVVSGASRGIGEAIALGMAESGADVALLSRSVGPLDKIASRIRELGREALVLPTDVTDLEQLGDAFSQIGESWETIDILVNNAGTSTRRRSLEVDRSDWSLILDTNLRAAFECSQHAARLMKAAGGGSIINIGSVAAPVSVGTGTPYAASKAGMEGMTRALAAEWGPEGIRVNTIAPWYFPTPLTEKLLSDERVRKAVEDRTPLRRIGHLDDLVGTAIFLASQAAAYITGQSIAVDGGFTINGFEMLNYLDSLDDD